LGATCISLTAVCRTREVMQGYEVSQKHLIKMARGNVARNLGCSKKAVCWTDAITYFHFLKHFLHWFTNMSRVQVCKLSVRISQIFV
jgi:hypothetical protein